MLLKILNSLHRMHFSLFEIFIEPAFHISSKLRAQNIAILFLEKSFLIIKLLMER